MMQRPIAMTIAGSDSGGGAGVQADLKTFTSLGVFGVSVITGLTAQNTARVTKVLEVPPEFVESQFDTIMEDFQVKYAKTGMLASSRIVDAVERKLTQYGINLVLDPVMISKSGYPLVTEEVVRDIVRLARKSLIITPNKYEAERLTGFRIRTRDDLRNTALHLYKSLGVNVVVKGGKAIGGYDFAVVDGDEIELRGELINTDNLHGSGDVFSASITAFLSKGLNLRDALREAKKVVSEAIKFSLAIGHGNGPVDPFSSVERVVKINQAREDLERLVEFLERNKEIVKKMITHEEKMNIGVLTEYGDFATLAGGIIRYIDWIKVDGPIVVNWYYNIVHKALKQTGKRLGILVSLTNEILNACEGGKLKISESGIYGDLVMIDGRAVLVGNSLSEIMEKLEVLRN
ncbi:MULTISPECIES: bifunctional hydroxymethylpyrimidine kinase/phosphomethylpyrimidine kinase [Metallosphaera]|uniref:Phosphomethylpyrimidine kinase n=3 Tax=Metallosphaera TaxID=41980 RepID=A4YD59_METS5|nr:MULTISPECIES: bifunctional hydroxymethylpyrimidine kinase/phosphomethylpyrimidine kinase [Metallosphaera]ABP94361.1 phosphomethylpyrimidine kinase [Metallosphaera sedula DSM 5348]AIM26348.1 phosphomethylpyrimidine kinase [Metallosphaera sedula]AKV73357.1 phosphomethylpyrimidine kinase [Metallosphaera sedula]AKV75601.1 phosphomethylpyrimidine kinase [Metallosphaera sedula]AKV77847.1 phosphomethylpyrimidine kinase [Metallosphaera sedula]